MSVAELEAEVLDVATALGVIRAGTLSEAFFEDPLHSVRTILTDPGQRAALLSTLDGLLAADGSTSGPDGSLTRHPLVDSAVGTLAISILRSGSPADPTVVVGLYGQAAADGFEVAVDIPLVRGDSGVTLVAATDAQPVSVTATVPVNWDRGTEPIGLKSVSLSALLVASPADHSRIALTLTGLDVGAGPTDLKLDPAAVQSELAHVLVALLRAGLAAGTSDPGVQALIDHLPTVLGVDGELPELPLGRLASDAGALRAWLGSLVTATVDGRPALVHWLDQLGQLLGAPALAATLTELPGEVNPVVIELVAPGTAGFGVELECFLATPAASTTPELHVWIRAGIAGDLAAARAEAELLVVPLGGNTATRTLTLAQIVAESNGPLWPRTPTPNADLAVGVARGGLRWDGTRVIPVLELDDVHLSDPTLVPEPISFDVLDLSSARTIAAEAEQAVNDALTNLIGSSGVAEAVRAILGLDTADTKALGRFANDPLGAIRAFHRGRLDAGTYGAVAQQIAALFGLTDPLTGSGTVADPWFGPLGGGPVPGGSTVTLGIAIWDVPDGADHQLHLGLRLTSPAAVRPGWSIALDVDLLRFALPAAGSARAGLLGAVNLGITIEPPAAAGALVAADHLTATASWTPGAPLRFDTTIAGVTITVDGAPVALGDISLPGGLTEQLIDDGWDAVRALLDRIAADWGGTAGSVLSALLGLGVQVGGLPAGWPTLTAPTGGIAELLSDPLALMRGRLAALADAVGAEGDKSPMIAALELIAGLIGGRLPAVAQPGVPPIPQGPAVSGNGTAESPFLLPLTDANTPLIAEPIELAVWFAPGPPPAWTQAAQALLTGGSASLPNVLHDLGGALPPVADALTGIDDDTAADWLAAAAAIDGTDGLVATDVGAALPTGATLAAAVTAAHHLAPASAAAVAAVTAHLQSHAAGLPVVLIAPTFAPDDVWAPMLTALARAGGSVVVDLRVPGVSPDVADLGAVTAADAYVVQLADDGTATLDALAARLNRVVSRILTVTGAGQVALVGHSGAGLIAIHYAATAATATRCAALATIAAPLVARLPPDDAVAAGVRLARSLVPGGVAGAAPALDAALQHLAGALDGCVGGAPSPYPFGTLTRALPSATDLSAVPSLVVPARLERPVVDAVASTLAAGLQIATAAATAPTHICWGLRAQVQLGTSAAAATGPQVTAHVGLDLGRTALAPGTPDPPDPARRLTVTATITDPSGWLLGSAGTGTPLQLRLRAAEVEFTAIPGAGASFQVTLYDAAVRGVGGPRLSLADVQAAELLGGLANALAAAAAGSPADALLQTLTELGLATHASGSTTASFYADAVAAAHTDPATFLAGRLLPALRSLAPQLGLTADPPTAGAPQIWRHQLGTLPFGLVIGAGPATVGVATTAPLQVAGVSLSVQATLALASDTPDLRTTVEIAGIAATYDNGTLQIAAPPVLAPATVLPPSSGTGLQDALLAALARTGIAGAISAVLGDALGGSVLVGSLAGLFSDPAGWLAQAGRLGATGGGVDAGRVTALLQAIATALEIPVAGDGSITVVPGLSIATTAGESTGDLAVSLQATNLDLGDDFELGLTLALDVAPAAGGGRTVTATGNVALTVPLPGSWQSLTIAAGDSPAGLTLAVTPHGLAPVQLLPTFSGLWDLIGGNVQALLTGALDALVEQLSATGASELLQQALAVADALGLRTGTPPTFDSGQMATLVDQITHGSLEVDLTSLAGVVQSLLPAAAPVTVNVAGSGAQTVLTIAVAQLPVPGTARLTAAIPTTAGPPTIGIAFAGVALGPVALDLTLADNAGILAAESTIAVTLPDAVADAIGFAFAPSLRVAAAPLTVTLAPLGTGDSLVVDLAPTPGVQRAELGALLTQWAVPIAGRIALAVAGDRLDTELWTGGTTPHALLRGAGLLDDTSSGIVVHRPLPDPPQLLHGLIGALGALRIPVAPGLGVGVYSEDGRVGIGASGTIDIPVGDYVLTPVLGDPAIDTDTWSTPAPGLGVLLLDVDPIAFHAGVRLGGVGLKLAHPGGALVDTSLITVGAVTALTQASVDFSPPAVSVTGGVIVEQLALPLGGSTSTANPVADSLLSPSGTPGDDKPANPPATLSVLAGDHGLSVLINGKDGGVPFYLDVQRSFGPLHIDRIGLEHKPVPGNDLIGALVDGGVSIAGLTVDVQGLELDVPLHHPSRLDLWQVDLAGLAVSLVEGPVVIEGGLLKRIPSGGGVEYDGELTVQVGAWGLTALGSYARSAPPDSFTSLFAFVVLDAPIGGPPFLFITGLAGGAGYNRQLIVPSDPAQVPTFPLVQAMDQGNTSADPIAPLAAMSAAMPARRGSYWVAAGIKFTTFELLQTRALAYVALDRGFQIGLIGLMDMALPTPSAAIVSVELALAASYSSADQLLAIRAQLTNNSWLISKDCQLTGGFAFYSWFGDHPQVLLTIGGDGPHWFKTPGDPHINQYPDVPPVGFHWAVGDGIVVKGETYFALTPFQLAFGGRLEASYDIDPIRIWFTVYVDVDFQWDPLQYFLDAGVSIGAAFHFTIDLFFGSITINISVSLSATIEIQGPPLHGTVTVDLDIASVTVHFGAEPAAAPYLNWPAFSGKYLATVADQSAGPGDGTSLTTITYGQLADSTKGAAGSTAADQSKPYGTADNPWPVRPEFGIAVASKAPLRSAQFQSTTVASSAFTGTFDVAPMGPNSTGFAATMTVVVQTLAGAAVATGDAEVSATYGGFPLSVWATSVPPQLSSNQLSVNSAPTMTQAMSGITVAFPITIEPAATPPDMPISTLVEDDLPKRPLPFTTTAAPAAQARVRTTVSPALESAAPASTPLRPRLRAVLPAVLGPAARATVATRAHGTDHHERLRAFTRTGRGGRGYLAAGAESHVWSLGDGAVVRGRGADPLRVTALSPVGRVLVDHVAVADELELELADEATTLVVTAAHDGPSGWTSRSALHQVGPGTVLGAGCAVLLPEPVTRAGRPLERVVRAAALTAGLDPVTTVLSARPGTIVVVLDACEPSAGDVTIEGDLEPVDEVDHGARRYIVCGARPRVARPVIEVTGTLGGRLAGVIGVSGRPRDWAARLRRDPAALPAPVPGPSAGAVDASYRINHPRRRSR